MMLRQCRSWSEVHRGRRACDQGSAVGREVENTVDGQGLGQEAGAEGRDRAVEGWE